MENQEQIQELLTAFEKKPTTDIPTALEEYLRYVAKTGKIVFPWSPVKALFVAKLEQVIEDFNKEMPYDNLPPFPNVELVQFDEMKQRVMDGVHKFSGAPFTIQRMCELVTQSRAHYTRCDKFLRGIEKNVMVVTTVDPIGRRQESQRLMVNGLDINGMYQEPRSDINDFTGGLPFSKIAAGDWSNNSAGVTSAWSQNEAGAMEGVSSGQSSAGITDRVEQTNGGVMDDGSEEGASGSSVETNHLVVSDSCPSATSQLPAPETSTTDSAATDMDQKQSETTESDVQVDAPSDTVPAETVTSSESLQMAASSSSDPETVSSVTAASDMQSSEATEAAPSEEVVEDTTGVEKRSAEEDPEISDEVHEGPPVKKLKVDKNPVESSTDESTASEEESVCTATEEEAVSTETEVSQSIVESTAETESCTDGGESGVDLSDNKADSEQPDSSTTESELPEQQQQELAEDNKTDIVESSEGDTEVANTDVDQTETKAEADSEQSDVGSHEDMESREHGAECVTVEESTESREEGVKDVVSETAEVCESETTRVEMMDTDSNAEAKVEGSETSSTSEAEPMEQE